MLKDMGDEGEGRVSILSLESLSPLWSLTTYSHLLQLLTTGLTFSVAPLCGWHCGQNIPPWLELVSTNILSALLCTDRKCLTVLLLVTGACHQLHYVMFLPPSVSFPFRSIFLKGCLGGGCAHDGFLSFSGHDALPGDVGSVFPDIPNVTWGHMGTVRVPRDTSLNELEGEVAIWAVLDTAVFLEAGTPGGHCMTQPVIIIPILYMRLQSLRDSVTFLRDISRLLTCSLASPFGACLCTVCILGKQLDDRNPYCSKGPPPLPISLPLSPLLPVPPPPSLWLHHGIFRNAYKIF